MSKWFDEEEGEQPGLAIPPIPPLEPPKANGAKRGRKPKAKPKAEEAAAPPPIPPVTTEVQAPPIPPAIPTGPNDDIPNFAPPPSVVMPPPPGHPNATVEESKAEEQTGAVEELYGIPPIPKAQGVDAKLIEISKETKIEVYKYPEKLLLEVSLDISIVKPRFAEAIHRVDLMCRMVSEAVVETDEGAQKLTGLLADMKRLEEKIDDTRLRLTKPYRESAGNINDFANSFSDKLKHHFKVGKGKLLTWQTVKEARDAAALAEQKRLNDQLQETLRKQAEEETKRNREEAAKQGIDPATVPAVPTPTVPLPLAEKPATKIKTEGATAFRKSEWVCEVYDPASVPREYCLPSQKLLDQAVENGVRGIPGCNIREKQDMNIRKR